MQSTFGSLQDFHSNNSNGNGNGTSILFVSDSFNKERNALVVGSLLEKMKTGDGGYVHVIELNFNFPIFLKKFNGCDYEKSIQDDMVTDARFMGDIVVVKNLTKLSQDQSDYLKQLMIQGAKFIFMDSSFGCHHFVMNGSSFFLRSIKQVFWDTDVPDICTHMYLGMTSNDRISQILYFVDPKGYPEHKVRDLHSSKSFNNDIRNGEGDDLLTWANLEKCVNSAVYGMCEKRIQKRVRQLYTLRSLRKLVSPRLQRDIVKACLTPRDCEVENKTSRRVATVNFDVEKRKLRWTYFY